MLIYFGLSWFCLSFLYHFKKKLFWQKIKKMSFNDCAKITKLIWNMIESKLYIGNFISFDFILIAISVVYFSRYIYSNISEKPFSSQAIYKKNLCIKNCPCCLVLFTPFWKTIAPKYPIYLSGEVWRLAIWSIHLGSIPIKPYKCDFWTENFKSSAFKLHF